MSLTEEIIILNTTRFSDRSLIIHCLSRKWGRRSFIVHSADKYSAFFQPLNILECTVCENPKSSLYSAKDFVTIHPLNRLRNSPGRNAISMFIAEVLFRSLKEEADEPGLFQWCVEEILLLDAIDGEYANFHLLFLLDYASALGFSPSLESLLPFLSNNATKAVSFLTKSPAEAMLIPMSGQGRSELSAQIMKYLEFHLEAPLKIRSLGVLSELF